MDMKLEVVVIPVGDVDRAKTFYKGLGWREDADFATGPDFRVVQLTPPGSPCSVIFGTGLTSSAPGSSEGMQLIVDDIETAQKELANGGAQVSEIFHDQGGVFHHAGTNGRARPAPTVELWLVGLVPGPRRQHLVRPGDHPASAWPGDAVRRPRTTRASDLAAALRRAAAAHGKHEEETGQPDANWPDWYAQFMVDERNVQHRVGRHLPRAVAFARLSRSGRLRVQSAEQRLDDDQVTVDDGVDEATLLVDTA